MQKWDYLTVSQARSYKSRGEKEYIHNPTDWETSYFENGTEKEWNRDTNELLSKLGEDGWELVSIIAESSFLGGAQDTKGTVSYSPIRGTEGSMYGITTDFAGFTTNRKWIFKRLRQG